jgi:hypothetical protein
MNTLLEFAPMIIVEPMSNPVATVGSRGCVTKEKRNKQFRFRD